VRLPSFHSLSRAVSQRLLPLASLLLVGIPSLHAADSTSPSTPHALDLRFEVTTFVLNIEKQGLQDNTFTNGLGRDTTLIGDFLNVSLHRQLAPRLEADLGVFLNMPFGYDTVVSQVRPIARLTYTPVDDVSARIGTLKIPHRDFLDAVFYYANRFLRPIEQGAQITADLEFYRQDLFINWEQISGGSSMPDRFDVGYAGQLRAGPLDSMGRFTGFRKESLPAHSMRRTTGCLHASHNQTISIVKRIRFSLAKLHDGRYSTTLNLI